MIRFWVGADQWRERVDLRKENWCLRLASVTSWNGSRVRTRRLHGLVRRAEIILSSAGGEANTSIARRLGVSNPTICHWRKKWFAQGIAGLYGEARPGRPRTHDEEAVAELLRTVLKRKPSLGTHWTVRSTAEATGLSKSTVARMLALFGVQPHRCQKLQALHRSIVCRQGNGHCRALSQSAGSCGSAVC
jgi:transposase